MAYETPMITELGSVAEFTRGDTFALQLDWQYSRGESILGYDQGS